MKTISIEMPIQEAVECIRLLRGESQCLLDNSETFQDRDVVKRAQLVLSARERMVTALEEIASTEDEPIAQPAFVTANIPEWPERRTGTQAAMDLAMTEVTGGFDEDGLPIEGEFESGIARRHA